MAIFSSAVSITRYQVDGKMDPPILDAVARGLKENAFTEIDADATEKAVGWTSFKNPYRPDFNESLVYGSYLVFSLRIDRKAISPKLFKKHFMLESAKRLAGSNRQYLSKYEKKIVQDLVINTLNQRIPATPNLFDLIWDYEKSNLCFFSNLKSANEELETIFSRSFNLTLIRLFPYTTADLKMELSSRQKDALGNLSPTSFME
jgi:recombination associated protein RdgC